jgi:hypothetical protein
MRRFSHVLALLLTVPAAALAQSGRPQVVINSQHDVSPPLRDMPPGPRHFGVLEAEPVRHIPSSRVAPFGPDAVLQPRQAALAPLAPATVANFDGIGQGFTGPAGTFVVNSAPPDTNGAVGPNHFVEVVNTDLAVFSKSGTPLFGPVPINTVWSGFTGSNCAIENDGDPIVSYDRIADRWIVSQFQVTRTPFQQCVAVSTTPDPTGTYFRYAFSYADGFPDYPKMGVWPDAYYVTYNVFNNAGTAFLYAKSCAFDRANMLTGAAATQVCFNTTNFGGLLPADFDGRTLPAAGAPNPIVALGATSTSLALWKFHTDFVTPANATFTGPTTLTVPAYTEACGLSGTCIPQSGGGSLDSLSDRLMYRAAYRNFGDHESIVVNHSVTVGSSVGLRWYELRGVTATPSVFQSGTFAPDANFRWMGSAAMDQSGNMAIGYSVSSSAIKPQIRVTGRLAGDAAGTLTQGETTVIAGAGAQGSTLSRWGDYSSMSVDPVDDCTFYYSTEYIPANGTFNWRTRIASFRLGSCGATPDFSLSASPAAVSVAAGGTGTSTITVTQSGGFTGAVDLSIAGLPAGASASFAPASTTTSSTLTLDAGTAAAGSYPLTVTGTSGALSHTTSVTLTVAGPADFALSASPSSVSASQGGSGTSTITVNKQNGFNAAVDLSVSGLPAGVTGSFNPATTTTTSVLTLTVGAAVATGSYPLTVTGTSGSLTHTTAVTLVVTAPGSFSLSAAPASLTVQHGKNGSYAITITRSGGFSAAVALSVSALPANVTASFNPSSTTGPSSTLTISASGNAHRGTVTLTITGTSAGAPTATTTVSLTVR